MPSCHHQHQPAKRSRRASASATTPHAHPACAQRAAAIPTHDPQKHAHTKPVQLLRPHRHFEAAVVQVTHPRARARVAAAALRCRLFLQPLRGAQRLLGCGAGGHARRGAQAGEKNAAQRHAAAVANGAARRGRCGRRHRMRNKWGGARQVCREGAGSDDGRARVERVGAQRCAGRPTCRRSHKRR